MGTSDLAPAGFYCRDWLRGLAWQGRAFRRHFGRATGCPRVHEGLKSNPIAEFRGKIMSDAVKQLIGCGFMFVVVMLVLRYTCTVNKRPPE